MAKFSDILNGAMKTVSLLEKIKSSRQSPASTNEEVESLKIIIGEQKRDSDYLLHIYNRMRAAEGLLLTATFGIIAYLYHSPDAPAGDKASFAQRLFFPQEDYGKAIYVIAAAFLIYGLLRLMLRVFGKQPWMTAYEIPKNDYTYKTLDILRYYKSRYDECLNFNGNKYYKRKEELNFLFYSMLTSAIILIVIKTLN